MIGRATLDDITSSDGRRFLGFEPYKLDTFVNEGERRVLTTANEVLGFTA